MNRRKKALLLASALSLCVLCGCGDNKTVEIEGVTYIQNGDEYTRLDISPKVFEPGEHKITYTAGPREGIRIKLGEEWEDNYYSYAPITPEGYELIDFKFVSDDDGYVTNIVFIYVNTKRVEASGVYNSKSNTVIYNTPGVVVEEKTLERGN